MMRATLLLTLLMAACGARPARFADRPPAKAVADDRPVPLPRRTPFVEAFHVSDVYLRRPLVDALNAERFPYAKDVNALDEVPRSSWFSPVALEPQAFVREYAAEGPPVPPLRFEQREEGWITIDSQGKTYALGGDVDSLPATTTAALVIGSRLVRALGYRTPETWLFDRDKVGLEPGKGPPGARITATRWPVGIELGPTDMTYPRLDDPNDRVSHRDRRTLRALGIVAAWLDLGELGPRRLVDVYVGRPGRGHVQHYVVGLEEALGAGRLGTPKPKISAVGTVRGRPFHNLWTLGLWRPNGGARPKAKSLLVLSPKLEPGAALAEPFEPVDRLLPSDGYWAAKQLARIPSELIASVVADARIPDPAVARHVIAALEARRRTLVAHWFGKVTPCEVEGISGRTLLLSDEERPRDAAMRLYRVELVGDEGDALSPPFWVSGAEGEVRIELPELERDYVVVRVRRERANILSRPMEAHLVQDDGTARLVGVRH